MARYTAARIETDTKTAATETERRRPRVERVVRTTLGDLIAACYDAVGPDADPEGVARLLRAPGLAKRIKPGYEIA